MAKAAASGVGLAYLWEERARPYIADGRLIECLASWSAPIKWLYLYYQTRKHLSVGLRAVIDSLRV
jgi:DNA-binding transcriptional LysR family regulator